MRAELLGCSVDVLTMAETVERARVAMRDRRRVQHVALNVAKFVNMRSDQILRSDVIGSDVIGIDGMGIVLALRLFGVPVKERVAGIDLCWEVLTVCARDGFRPFLLGATPDVLHRAKDAIVAHFPSIQFAGLRAGYVRPSRAACPPNHAVDGARMAISNLPGAAAHVVAICQDKYPFRRNTDSRH